MKDKTKNIIFFILLMIVACMMFWFIYNTYRLYKFRNCYDNDFQLPYCESYKNY